MIVDNFENQIFFSTLRITIPGKQGENDSIGTGFLCTHPLRIDGQSGVFLVSNRHVFGDPKSEIILNFHKRDGALNQPRLGEIISHRFSDFSNVYCGHPDPKVDLACINVSALVDPDNGAYCKHFPPDFFISKSALEKIPPGQLVSFVGYPDNRFDSKHNLPILRKGYIATMPKIDFNGFKEIVIDAQVFRGSSGSPVFVEGGDRHYVIGVVAQAMVRSEKLQTIEASKSHVEHEFGIGLGIVLKSESVLELLGAAAARLSDRVEARRRGAEKVD